MINYVYTSQNNPSPSPPNNNKKKKPVHLPSQTLQFYHIAEHIHKGTLQFYHTALLEWNHPNNFSKILTMSNILKRKTKSPYIE